LPVVGSVPEALQLIDDLVKSRRQLLIGIVRDRRNRHEPTRRAAIPS
jgi:hypothetical protein